MTSDTTTAPTDSAEPPAEQPGLVVLRAPDGTFLPGSASPSPGRPRRETEQRYLTALTEGVNEADWRGIIARAVTDARAGDAKARAFLALHLLPVRVDVSKYLLDANQAYRFIEGVLGVIADNISDRAILQKIVAEMQTQMNWADFS